MNLNPPLLSTTHLGQNLLVGRLVATYTGNPEGHITVEFRTWAPGRRTPDLDQAARIYVQVPGQFGDKIGNIDMRSGKFWPERTADPSRIAAAEHILAAAQGQESDAQISKSTFCFRCGLELTHPESIGRGYGPHCYGQVTSGEHQTKVKQIMARLPVAPPAPVAPAAPVVQPDATIEYDSDHAEFLIRFSFGDNFTAIKDIVKQIPARHFDGARKLWTVPAQGDSVPMLRKLFAQFKVQPTEGALAVLKTIGRIYEKENVEKIEREAASKAHTADVTVEGLGGELLPFQQAGVAAVRLFEGRCFIADEQGLGKTIQALAAIQDRQAFPALIICESHTKLNWERETNKWLPGRTVSILKGRTPSTILDADVTICNYDILDAWLPVLSSRFHALVIDESQKAKNPKAKRTQAVKALADTMPAHGLVLELTGTPVINRPIELIPQLDILGKLDLFGGERKFKNRYCFRDNPSEYGKGDYLGARNLDELNLKLRQTCYIRRNKQDVYGELPEIFRSIVPLELDNEKEYLKARDNFSEWMRENDELPPSNAEWLVQISKLKQLSAQGKLAQSVAWIKDFCNGEGGPKLIIYAYHKAIQEALIEALPGCAHVTADDIHKGEHQAMIDAFQNDPSIKVIVCSLKAAQTGITLTAASNVAFLEFDWTPAAHDQAEARCYGRVNDMHGANSYYLTGLGSIDEDIIKLVDKKRKVVTAATEGGDVTQVSVLTELINTLKNETK